MDTKSLEELIRDPNNPKTLSEFDGVNLANSMTKYGDLSPVVFNRKLGKLVGGNSRVNLFLTKLIGNNRVVYTTKYDEPDKQGTVALGHIWHNDTAFAYREVEFDEVTHREANIAASVIHGDLVDQLLAEANQFIMENNGDVFATGQAEEDINKLLEQFSGLELQTTEPDDKPEKPDDGFQRVKLKLTQDQYDVVYQAIAQMKHDRQLTGSQNPDLDSNAIYYICRGYIENAVSQNADQTNETTPQTPADAPVVQTVAETLPTETPTDTQPTETPTAPDLASIPS